MIVRTRPRNYRKATGDLKTEESNIVPFLSLTTDATAINFTNLTLPPAARGHHGGLFLPTGVIAVLVLAALCAIMGMVYAYVYFTRISNNGPSSKKLKHALKTPRSGSESLRVPHVYDDERSGYGKDSQQQNSTHVFLFKFRR